MKPFHRYLIAQALIAGVWYPSGVWTLMAILDCGILPAMVMTSAALLLGLVIAYMVGEDREDQTGSTDD